MLVLKQVGELSPHKISLRSLLWGTPIRLAETSIRRSKLLISKKQIYRSIGIERTAKQRGRTDGRTEGAFALNRLRIAPLFLMKCTPKLGEAFLIEVSGRI